MSRFNIVTPKTKIYTYEGGKAYKKDIATNWTEFLLGSFMTNSFYETEEERMTRFYDLTDQMINKYGPEFVAKASIFARDVCGMRTATHMVASKLNEQKFDSKRRYFKSIVRRPDDISEILACVDSLGDKRSHAMIRGFGDALSCMSAYQLGKYKMENHDYSLVDCVNICHPKANDQLTKLMNGTLESPYTWEVSISSAKDDKDKAQKWYALVRDDKLGLMAEIRNLNNILEATDHLGLSSSKKMINLVANQITDEEKIKKSLVLPMRFYTAYKNLRYRNTTLINALDQAFLTSVENMPTLDGNNCLILDVSVSMMDRISPKSDLTIAEASAVYAVAFFLANDNVSLVKFGNDAKFFTTNRFDSPFHLIEQFIDNENLGGGTDFSKALLAIKNSGKKFDRVISFSDEQTFDNHYSWRGHQIDVKDMINADINTNGTQYWSYDLGCYSNGVFNPYSPNVHSLTSLSPEAFKVMPLIEKGEGKLVDYIGSFEY